MTNESTSKSADDIARSRAEDLAYTLNHSVYCGFTDLFKAPLNAATDNKLSFLIPGCGHDHSAEGGHHHYDHDHGGHDHAAPSKPSPPPPSEPDPFADLYQGPPTKQAPPSETTLDSLFDASPPAPTTKSNSRFLAEETTTPSTNAAAPHVHGPDCGHEHHTHRQGRGRNPSHTDSHCTHDHHGHSHISHAPGATRWQRFKKELRHSVSAERLGQYVRGEFIADFAAVPLTLATQRFFPGFMESLSQLCATILRPIFSIGATRHTRRWAKAEGVSEASTEFQEKRDALVDYDIKHFPQAAAWTGYSVGINTAYQMHADKRSIPFWNKLALKVGTVSSASAITAGVVVTARALSPKTMHSLDGWVSDRVVLPTSKTIGRLFGITPETIEEAAKKEEALRDGGWVERTATSPTPEQAARSSARG